MRRILLVIGLLLGAACYIAWPFYTAWSIKEAVKSGDSTYLAQHFEWTPIKETLKASMADMVLGPIDTALEDKPQRQGLWASFKAYYGRNMVHGMVERYATPTGLSTLFSYGRTVSVNVLGRVQITGRVRGIHTQINMRMTINNHSPKSFKSA